MSKIPDEAWPAGDLLEWGDDETRTHYDFFNETSRPYSDEENAAADARASDEQESENEDTLREQVIAARASNKTFLDLASPTTAQAVSQVKALTRQMNALIRLVARDLSGTD